MKFALDFDGVILKNNYIYEYMFDKSTKYLKDTLKISYKLAHNYQKQYLKKLGHTANIATKINKKCLKINMDKYNEYVFNDKEMMKMMSMITIDDIVYMCDFMEEKENNNHEYILFTNGTIRWVDYVLATGGIKTDNFFEDTYSLDNNALKPNISAYENIEQNHDNFIYIDDNIENLKPIENRWNVYNYKRSDTPNILSTLSLKK